MKKLRLLKGLLLASSLFLLGGCQSKENPKKDSKNSVNLAYVDWDTEVASTTVVAEVLKDMGYDVTMTPLDSSVMWEAVASGEADAMVGAWLPGTHRAQYEKFKDKVENLGPNLKDGARLGIVVPSYMQVNSIEELTKEADKTIFGIDPGAGVVIAAEKVLTAYPNMKSWQMLNSSGGAVMTQLGKSIKKKEEIVITGWSPHWMFSRYDLKYLEDPKGVMGGKESIHSMARLGLKQDKPEVYHMIDAFSWNVEDIESIMLEIEKGEDPTKAARNWINEHPEKVEEWKKAR